MSKRKIPIRRVEPTVKPVIKKTIRFRKPTLGGSSTTSSTTPAEEPTETSSSPSSSTSNSNTMEPFIGQIIMFGGNFAPRGWAFCDGQLLSISTSTALFSILGTTYGGDGRTTFGLPDMRGRVSMHQGHGLNLTNRRLGSKEGAESVTLSVNNLPSHTHNFNVVGNGSNPSAGSSNSAQEAAPDTTSSVSQSITKSTGGGQPLSIMQPSTVVSYIIATEGVFPSRS